jgi:opacity protein-like surface antigen
MDEREANIDVLFRNGLKNYEVLPPPEVWDNIRPAIRKQQQPYIILRAAATIAVLISLGFLAYEWSNQFSNGLVTNPVPQSSEPGSPSAVIPEATLLVDAGRIKAPVTFYTTQPAIASENIVKEEEIVVTAENVAYPLLPGGFTDANSRSTRSDLIALNSTRTNDINVEEYTPLYLPEIPVNNKTERWTIAALVSPTYMSSFHTGENAVADQLVSAEQPIVSYAGGVALSYKVSKRFSVQSGLYYSSYGNKLTGITSFAGFQNYDQMKSNHNFEILTTNGTVYTSNSDIYLIDKISDNRMAAYYDKSSFDPAKASLQYLDNSLRQNLSYLELPVILRYKLVDRAVDFNIVGGLSSNLLVNNSVYTSLDGGKYEVGKTEGLNTITFSSSLGMGMEYSFTENLSLNLEPTFRYYLNPFSNITGMKIHPYSFGIFSGLSYKF